MFFFLSRLISIIALALCILKKLELFIVDMKRHIYFATLFMIVTEKVISTFKQEAIINLTVIEDITAIKVNMIVLMMLKYRKK